MSFDNSGGAIGGRFGINADDLWMLLLLPRMLLRCCPAGERQTASVVRGDKKDGFGQAALLSSLYCHMLLVDCFSCGVMGLEENEANKLTALPLVVERGVPGVLGGKGHGGKLGSRPHSSLRAGMVSNLGKYDQRGEELF